MKTTSLLILAFCFLLGSCNSQAKKIESQAPATEVKVESPKTIQFPSLDSLIITAHLYQIDDTSPFILLCHQARFNKFEYAGIAEKLNEMGFNCMAIDQRSGGPIGNKQNETYLKALTKGKDFQYLDAEPDLRAAIQYASKHFGPKIILWGSSYSSTLALYLAAEMDEVQAVISFSPGNYFAEQKGSLVDVLEKFEKPMFLTSSKSEAKYVKALLEKHKLSKMQTQFIPNGAGHHGSRALWINQQGGEEYWVAINKFLNQIKDN